MLPFGPILSEKLRAYDRGVAVGIRRMISRSPVGVSSRVYVNMNK